MRCQFHCSMVKRMLIQFVYQGVIGLLLGFIRWSTLQRRRQILRYWRQLIILSPLYSELPPCCDPMKLCCADCKLIKNSFHPEQRKIEKIELISYPKHSRVEWYRYLDLRFFLFLSNYLNLDLISLFSPLTAINDALGYFSTSVVLRHPSRLVPSRNFPIGIESKGNGWDKNL